MPPYRGESEISAVCHNPSNGLAAVDLGAGFGMHSIPLARRGYSVVAIDCSLKLLEALREYAKTLPIHVVEEDLLAFQKHLSAKVHLILCMGDTLTHLPDRESVARLFFLAAESLHGGGMFIITFRDYTAPLVGDERFTPVRSDKDRILTCFLEYSPDTSPFTMCSMSEMHSRGNNESALIENSGSRRNGYPGHYRAKGLWFTLSQDSQA